MSTLQRGSSQITLGSTCLFWVASYDTVTMQLLLYIVTTKLFYTLTNKYDDDDDDDTDTTTTMSRSHCTHQSLFADASKI